MKSQRFSLLVLAILLGTLAVGALDPARAGNTSPIRVACLGDSLTLGDGDDSGGGYPARLQARLGKTRPGSKVANYGVSGQSSRMVLDGYEQHPSQVKQALAFRPDVACLWVGSNDLWYLYEYNNPSPADEAADVRSFRRNVGTILDRLRQRNVRLVVALLDDQSKRPVARQGKAFPGISKAELTRMSSQVKGYNAALRAEAARCHATLVDFSTTTVFTDPATLTEDGNHPNARGYDRIADLWWKALK